jgi:dTDP-4-amino-4,6-dideoxygalactose transaminase
MKIPLIKPVTGNEEIENIKKVLKSGFLTQWKITKKFEKEFAKFVKAKYAIATTSCTASLHLSMMEFIKRGDEVILPSFTFPACANVILAVGGIPVFCDIELDSFTIDVNKVEDSITDKTKAIMPVHLAGHSADLKPLIKIARKYKLKIIEDAACGIGVKYKNKHVGTFGKVGCFSFHPRKLLTTGEGGMIVTNNKTVYEDLGSLKNHGRSFKSSMKFTKVGLNYRMSDILAAIGIAQLRKIKKIIKRRIELAKYYTELLEEIEEVRAPIVKSYSNHTFQSYIILLKKEGIRDKLMLTLRKKGIETQIGTFAVHLQPAYRKYVRKKLPNSEYAFKNTLILPLYHKMKYQEIEYVVRNIKDFLRRKN